MSDIITEGVGSAGCLMVNFSLADTIEIQKWVIENVPAEVTIEPEHETHITILYGVKGSVTVDKVREFVEQLPLIVVRLGSINFFNQPDQDVLKISVDSPQLQQINNSFKKFLGEENIEPSKYDYNPHVTLAYIHSNSLQHLNGNDRFKGYVYLLNEVVYSEPDSKRKHYF